MRDLLACMIACLVCAHLDRVVVLRLGDERIGFRSEWTEVTGLTGWTRGLMRGQTASDGAT